MLNNIMSELVRARKKAQVTLPYSVRHELGIEDKANNIIGVLFVELFERVFCGLVISHVRSPLKIDASLKRRLAERMNLSDIKGTASGFKSLCQSRVLRPSLISHRVAMSLCLHFDVSDLF